MGSDSSTWHSTGFESCFAVFSPEKRASGCGQLVKCKRHCGKLTNEAYKVGSQFKETGEFFLTKRPGKIKNCIDLVMVGAYSFLLNNMAKALMEVLVKGNFEC